MQWIEQDGTWKSGPYTIELLAPEIWALSRDAADPGQAIVEVEGWWTDRSLRAMKRKAEFLEADRQRRWSRNRHLMTMVGAILVSALAASGSGPAESILAIAAAGTALFSLIRSVERTFERRPWEFVSKNYQ